MRLLLLLLALSPALLFAQFSTFDFDNEGWSATGDAQGDTVYWLSSSGNPGGCIKAIDLNTGISWYFVAPPCFLGDKSAAYGKLIQYDVRTTVVSTTNYTGDIILYGTNGLVLYHNYGQNAGTAWTHFSVFLIESNFHVGGVNGPIATQAQMQSVLGDLSALRIRGEYHNGDDQGFLDNVRLGELPLHELAATLCQGSYIYHGTTLTLPGVYDFSLESSAGCDSLVRLILEEGDTSLTVLSASICAGSSYTLPNGQQATQPGTYTALLENAGGCDSTVIVTLGYLPGSYSEIPAAICPGESFTLPNGQVVSQPGSYPFAVYPNNQGCDSTVAVALSFLAETGSQVAASICPGESYPLPNGQVASQPGTYPLATLTNAAGCDSTITLALSVLDTSLTQQRASICPGDHFTLPDGQNVTLAGTYHSLLQKMVTGCDSTIATTLDFFPTADTTVEVLLKEGVRYVLPDGAAVQDTFLEKSFQLQTVHGCDSTVLLRVKTIYIRVYFPNVFTPDFNGDNDEWLPYANENVSQILTLRIFDRWGDLVFARDNFQPNQPALGWDGRFRGREALPGVYAWQAEVEFLDGSVGRYSGDLTLLR